MLAPLFRFLIFVKLPYNKVIALICETVHPHALRRRRTAVAILDCVLAFSTHFGFSSSPRSFRKTSLKLDAFVSP